MAKSSRPKFQAWPEQLLPDDTAALIKAYENGFIGAGQDKEAEAALRHDCQQQFGHDNLDDIATANGWGDSGAGKLSPLFVHIEKLWPGAFPGTAQTVGSCVSHGTKNAMLGTLAGELASGKPDPASGEMEGVPEVPPEGIKTGVIHPSPIYWTRGYNGHGWSCSTAARNVVNKVGAVVCKPYPFYDLTKLNRSIECLYGSQEPPQEWRTEFSKHVVRAAAEINSFEALRDAIHNGYGVSSCGSEGYSSSRDENGVSKRSGSWAHAMAYLAVDDRDEIKKVYDEPLVLIQNSWGNWNSGPRRILGTSIDIPPGSFWCRWSQCKNRYMVALSNVKGWPPQKLPDYGTPSFSN